MTDSVIFNSPHFLILYGAALALCLFGLKKRTGAVTLFLSALIVVATSAFAILGGAALFEVAAVVAVFLILAVSVKGGDANEL